MLIDSHAHLTAPAMMPHTQAMLERAGRAHIQAIISIATTPQEAEDSLALNSTSPLIFTVGATTPHDVEKEGEAYFDAFAALAKKGRFVAIGETGLDYYYEHSNRDLQKEFLIRYLKLAEECHLPIVIHCREAFEDFFEIIDRAAPSIKGVCIVLRVAKKMLMNWLQGGG